MVLYYCDRISEVAYHCNGENSVLSCQHDAWNSAACVFRICFCVILVLFFRKLVLIIMKCVNGVNHYRSMRGIQLIPKAISTKL